MNSRVRRPVILSDVYRGLKFSILALAVAFSLAIPIPAVATVVNFGLGADDYGSLTIDGKPICTYDNISAAGGCDGSIDMAPGVWYDISIDYKNRNGSDGMALTWDQPGDQPNGGYGFGGSFPSLIPKAKFRTVDRSGAYVGGLRGDYYDLSGNLQSTVIGEGPINAINNIYNNQNTGSWNGYGYFSLFEERLSGQIQFAECPSPLKITLTQDETDSLQFVAAGVLPELGTLFGQDEAIRISAQDSWWGLKEGSFDSEQCKTLRLMNKPLSFSECAVLLPKKRPQSNLCPLEECGRNQCDLPGQVLWQVGLGAVQVTQWTEDNIKNFIEGILKRTEDEVLTGVADAAIKNDPSTHDAIVGSTGCLRKSWLMRHPVVGFYFVNKDVQPCFGITRPKWCDDGNRTFGGNEDTMNKTVTVLEAFFRDRCPVSNH